MFRHLFYSMHQLLTAETLAEFEQKLLGYLPKDEAQK